MPKTTKRAAAKRAAKIAKAHATQLPELEVKEPRQRKSVPGYKPPARGIARYPWATFLTLALLALTISILYFNHIGPFALPPKPKTSKPATATASPCASDKIVSQVNNTSPAPTVEESNKITRTYRQPEDMKIDTKKLYCAGINTNRGLIVVELRPEWAPHTVNNFMFLAQNKFYDGLAFHRVIQSGDGLRIIQGGDPLGNDKDPAKRGTGGPGYKFSDEQVKGEYTEGTIAMANSGPNTNGSQFFINTADNTKALEKKYNLFGIVVKGLDVAKKIQGPNENNKNVTPDVINHITVVPAS